MPQMMPMFWSLMFIFMILITLMTISFFSLLMPPMSYPPKYKLSTLSQWSWMW